MTTSPEPRCRSGARLTRGAIRIVGCAGNHAQRPILVRERLRITRRRSAAVPNTQPICAARSPASASPLLTKRLRARASGAVRHPHRSTGRHRSHMSAAIHRPTHPTDTRPPRGVILREHAPRFPSRRSVCDRRIYFPQSQRRDARPFSRTAKSFVGVKGQRDATGIRRLSRRTPTASRPSPGAKWQPSAGTAIRSGRRTRAARCPARAGTRIPARGGGSRCRSRTGSSGTPAPRTARTPPRSPATSPPGSGSRAG